MGETPSDSFRDSARTHAKRTPPRQADQAVASDRRARRVRLWRRQFALPPEHGAWIWWIGPLGIGTAAARRLVPDLIVLALTALGAFLLRQPVSMLVKSLSGRRPREDVPAALFWAGAYGLLTSAAGAVLVLRGHRQVIWLAFPALAVFAWHLWLIRRRAERGQWGVEVVGAGVLALAAPAAFWVCGDGAVVTAGVLWTLTWLQSAASIVLVYQRLAQRSLQAPPSSRDRWRMGRRSLLYNGFNVFLSVALVGAGLVPPIVPGAFTLMLLDAMAGTLRPPLGARPTSIGFRQLGASLLFVAVMVLAYMV